MDDRFAAMFLAMAMALATAATAAPARALEPGDDQFPNSIVAPERGTTSHHRASAPAAAPSRSPHHASLLGRERFVAKLHRGPNMFATRGSSGSVPPTSQPRTGLVGYEGGGRLTETTLPREQGPSVVPGLTGTVPNLPHGPETFQDRASRCAFQSGLYGVPGGARTQYMGSCVQ